MKNKADLDNHSRNLNPKDEQYWRSRGEVAPLAPTPPAPNSATTPEPSASEQSKDAT